MSSVEKEIIDICVKAYLEGDDSVHADEVFSWYETDPIDQDKLRKIIEQEVQNVTILKPYYDFNCFSLVQQIGSLTEHRNAAWIQHSDVDG